MEVTRYTSEGNVNGIYPGRDLKKNDGWKVCR